MVGTREAEAVATESGGVVATESGGAVATDAGGAATTGDETVAAAGDQTAANGEVMYADEDPYAIDVRHVEKMVETTREAANGGRVRRGQDGDETGDETGDKMAATAGDERDDGDRWGNVYGRRGVII